MSKRRSKIELQTTNLNDGLWSGGEGLLGGDALQLDALLAVEAVSREIRDQTTKIKVQTTDSAVIHKRRRKCFSPSSKYHFY